MIFNDFTWFPLISCRGSLVPLLKTVASVGRRHGWLQRRGTQMPNSSFFSLLLFCCFWFAVCPRFVFPPRWAMALTSCLPWPSLCVLPPPLLGLEPPLLPGRGLLAPLRFSLRRHPGLLRLLRGAAPFLYVILLYYLFAVRRVARFFEHITRDMNGAPGLGDHACRGPSRGQLVAPGARRWAPTSP